MKGDNYDIAQICLSGHVINPRARAWPDDNRQFCADCGKATITNCPDCGKPVRGSYIGAVPMEWPAPKFCEHCGKPFPWTSSALEAARALADEEANLLTDQEKAELKRVFDDLVTDTPRVNVAVLKYKRLTKKAGTEVAQALRQILISIAAEAVKQRLWPNG